MPRMSSQVLIGCFSALSLLLVSGPATGQPREAAGSVESPLSLRDATLRAIDIQQAPGPQKPERRHDSLLNGVLIGAGVGALLGLIPDYYDDCEECHDSLYASIAVGAGVGLLIDALRTSRPAVSRATAEFPGANRCRRRTPAHGDWCNNPLALKRDASPNWHTDVVNTPR